MEKPLFVIRYDEEKKYLYIKVADRDPLFLTSIRVIQLDSSTPTFYEGKTLLGTSYFIETYENVDSKIKLAIVSGGGTHVIEVGYCLISDFKNTDIPQPYDQYLNTEWENIFPDISPENFERH